MVAMYNLWWWNMFDEELCNLYDSTNDESTDMSPTAIV